MKMVQLPKAFSAEYIRSPFYKKVLVSFLLCSCAVALLFCGVLLYASNRDYAEELESTQERTIALALNINSANLTDIVTYCNNQLETSAMNSILYGGSLNSVQSYDAVVLNTAMRRMSSLIHSVYFINFRTSTIIDQNGKGAIGIHPDQDIFQRLSALTPGRSALLCVPREISYISSSHTYSGVRVVSLIFYPNASGALVVNLDYGAYSKLFMADTGAHVRFAMLNSAGEIFLSTDPDLFGQASAGTSVYEQIQQAADNFGTIPFTAENGQRYTFRYAKNQGLGITYLSSLDTVPFYSDNTQLSHLILLALALIAVGLVLSIVLSSRVYDPLKKLKQTVAKAHKVDEAPGDIPYDDFAYLTSAWQDIVDANAQLKKRSDELRNTRLLLDLLYDTHDMDLRSKGPDLEALSATFPAANYAVLVLGLDGAENEAKSEVALLLYAIQNVAQELISALTHVDLVPVNADYLILLLNFETLDGDRLAAAVQQAQDVIHSNFEITFSAGLGDTVQDLQEISQSFQTAQQAFARRFLTGTGSYHTAGEVPVEQAKSAEYPYEASQGILDGVRGLSPSAVEQNIALFFQAVQGCGIDEILSFIAQLHFTLQRLERQNYLSVSGDWCHRTLEESTLEEITARLRDRCLSDISQLTVIREASSGRRELIDQIKALVEDNLCSPELSVAYLADQVHLSVNYLRNVFKESTGASLSGYINQKKVELICHLLLETDLTLSEINDRLGFSTSNYFYAFFKKHMGVTPGEYRKRGKRGEELPAPAPAAE